jgi:pimeloyl-ACP methyl ester carboxylesterase
VPWLELPHGDIYYLEEGSGPPLVFLHGNSSCAEAWWQQFEAFRARFRCIAYDSVNHGHSSNSPRDADEPDRADELEAVLAALGVERPILAGNSMGANTLLRWAVRHPERALALIPSGMGVPLEGEEYRPPFREPLGTEVLFIPTGDALTDRLRRERPLLYERYLRIRSTATRLEALRYPRRPSPKSIQERAALAQHVGTIRSPMSIIVGSLDRLLPNAERLHRLVPGSEFHVIEGAPHNVYYEAAEEYNAIVARFLDRVLAGATP